MYYEESDFLETADPDTLRLIARARRLTNAYNQTAYENKEEKNTILRKLLGSIGTNVSIGTPFYCDHGNQIFLGNDIVIGMNCTFVDNQTIRIGKNSVIGAGSVVTRSIPANCVAVGNPCRAIRFFRPEAPKISYKN